MLGRSGDMTGSTPRLYDDLAWLWPLWGDASVEYPEWCRHVVELVERDGDAPAKTLLNLGCGGGKNAWNLKRTCAVTGVDISGAMLDLAAELNPECTFVLADMRTCDLGAAFDAVLIDDSVSYMTSRADLRAVFDTAWRHLRDGGVMVVSPDMTKETFVQNRTWTTEGTGKALPEDMALTFVENYYDPDPDDETCEGTMVYLIREAGRLRVETDVHVLGLFPVAVWRETLGEIGFEVHEEKYAGAPADVPTFACVKRDAGGGRRP